MNDELGNRMKEQYEDRTRYTLPRRTYTVIRVDGKAFHSFTKGMQRPFDQKLMELMDKTAIALCKNIQGVRCAFVQSDEISLVLTDFTDIKTQAWFDGNLQKMTSIAASIATAYFNAYSLGIMEKPEMLWQTDEGNSYPDHSVRPPKLEFKVKWTPPKLAMFDARVFTIPDREEVINYLIWRQQDATRNSIQSVAQSLYSQKELHGKNCNLLQEMIFQKGINWNDYTSGEKRGRLVVKLPIEWQGPTGIVSRNTWFALTGKEGNNETPIFTQDRESLYKLIPLHGEVDDASRMEE